MNDVIVSVKKLTDVDLLREACESTFLGKSKASLISLYKAEHSPVRTQLFWVTFKNLKLFVATHFVRHHVGSVPFQLTCRDDRQGGYVGAEQQLKQAADSILQCNKSGTDMKPEELAGTLNWLAENSDRNTKVNLSLLINAQSLIDMAKVRLCSQAHKETVAVFKMLKQAIAEIDPELSRMMVRKCVYRCGLCGEMRCCGFNHTTAFKKELESYLSCFSEKQIGETNKTQKP